QLPANGPGLPDVAALASEQNRSATTSLQANPQDPGFLHFVSQSDLVGKSLFVVLIVMSLVSWYLIIVKLIAHIGLKARVSRVLDRFWRSASLEAAVAEIRLAGGNDPFSRLALNAINARDHYERFGSSSSLEDGGSEG